MKKLLKVVLPPLAAFLIFAALVKFSPFAKHIKGLADIGDETTYGLMTYYKIFAPLLFLTALLTQLLIVIPLWRKILARPGAAASVLTGIAIVCVVLSAGIGYTIWDDTTGTQHLVSIFLFMAGVQVAYWLINLGVLFLIDRKQLQQTAALPLITTDVTDNS